MKKYRASTAILAAALPLSIISACGDEGSDAPPASGGTAGDAGDGGKGGSKGGSSGNGGTESGGSSGKGGGGSGGKGGRGGSETGGSGGAGDGGGGTGGMPDPGCDLSGDGLERQTVPSEITANRTLTSGTVWVLDGFVKVHDGATLTIEPCTRIEGTPAPDPGVLAILRGGRINAVGTADEPILFTTSAPVGARSAGQWGGVVLLGRTPIGAASAGKIFEGLTDADFTYGGTDAADNSGRMSYVRIEFAGWNILPDKEINGLSMAAVGSGTRLDHIMVSNIRDDCFEWWGGTVDADYLICNNPGDDMFDTDEGYVGSGSHWFGRRTDVSVISSSDPTGFEWDGTENGASLTPRTNVTLTNATLCGTGVAVSMGGGAPEFGMVLRELVTGELDNVSVLGFEYGIDTRNAFMTGDLTIDNSTFWSLLGAIGSPDTSDNDAGFVDDSIFTGGMNNEGDPDPLPFTLEQCQAVSGPAAAVKNSDVGAFAGDATWMDGLWVDWSED